MKLFQFAALVGLLAFANLSFAQNLPSKSLPVKEYNYTTISSNASPLSKEIWAKFNPENLHHSDLGMIYANAADRNSVEIISKRSEYGKYYINPNKPTEFYIQKSLKPLHYKVGNEWHTIDYRLKNIGGNQYEASAQLEPVGFDLSAGKAYIKTTSGKVNFNQWTLVGKNSVGTKTILGKANWANATVGNNGVFVTNIFDGIDAEMRVARGGIKTSFIVKENKFSGFSQLIFEDEMGNAGSLAKGKEGKLALQEAGKSLVLIDDAVVFLKNNPENPTKLNYEINKNKLGVVVDVAFIERYIGVSPIVIDPLVTGTSSFASTKAVGSMYNASCSFSLGSTSTCAHDLEVATPAGATFSDVVWTFGFEAKSPCLLNKGYFNITSGSCISPFSSGIWIADYAVTGTAEGVNMPAWSQFGSCLPAPSCSPGSITFTLNFGRGCVGPTGCDNSCIGEAIDYPFSFTIKGNTVEHDSGIVMFSGSKKDTVCQGATVGFKTKTKGGIKPYSTTNWSSSRTGTPSLAVGDSLTRTFTSPGTYWTYAITSDACSNISIDSQQVFVDSVIAPLVVSPVNYCQGKTASVLTATARSSTDTLLWYAAAIGGTGTKVAPTPTTSATGSNTYYVSQLSKFGCEGTRAAIVVNVNANPSAPTVVSPIQLCQGVTPSALSATGSDLKWYSADTGGIGSATATIPSTSALGSTTYYVSQSNTTTGCESPRAAIAANVNAIPSAPTVTTPIQLCEGISATALSATGSNLLWYTAATGGTGSSTAITPSTSTATATTYYVSQTSAASTGACESPRAALVVNVNAKPSAPTIDTGLILCVGSSASALTATGTNLKWYNAAIGGTGSTVAPTPSTATFGNTSYFVSQSLAATSGGCESDRSEIVVTVNTNPASPIVTTPIQLCVGATASALTATGTDLKWYSAATGGTGSAVAPTPSTGTATTLTYYVTQSLATTSGGCESSRTPINVVVNANPSAPTITTPVTYCQFITASALSASGTNLKWYSAATGGTGSATSFTPSTSTATSYTYYVSQSLDATSGSCESPRASVTVNVNPAPANPTVTTPVVYCQNITTASALSATGTGLKWYTAATGGTGSTTAPTPTTTTAASTTYYVTQTNSATSCESLREPLVVTINPQPAAPAVTSPIAYCNNATTATALGATGTSLLWYSAATGGTGSTTAPTPITTSTGATSFYVSQTNSFTCESPRTAIVVNINPLPAAPTVTTPINLCIGSTAAPLSVVGTSLKWYTVTTGGTATSSAPTPATSSLGNTDYFVSQTNSFTCEGPRAKVTVQVQPLPVVSITSLSSTGFIFCREKTIDIKAIAPTATDFQWSYNGSILPGATVATTAAATTGNYKIDVTDVYGCKNKDSVWVQKDTSIIPVLSPAMVAICEESSILFTVSPGYASWSFNWQKDGTPIIPATPTSNIRNLSASGNYTVITSNSFGCIDTTNIAMITYLPKPPKPTITNTYPLLQIPNLYKYYQWNRNNTPISGATNFNYTVGSNGYYFVEVTDANGCKNQSDTIRINISTSISNTTNAKAELKIYPNPTRNIVHIDAPIKTKVKVTDLAGRVVLDMRETNEINIEAFAQGTYLFLITDMDNNILTVEKIQKMD